MEKINIAEILKNCPKGMELDCTIFNDVTLYRIDTSPENEYPIRIETKNGNFLDLTKYGTYSNVEEAKCVIFPKGKTTWERFQRPFKDGDVVFYNDTIAIFKEWGDETLFRTYVAKYLCCDSLIDTNVPLFGVRVRKEIRFATEEEKAKLFDAIKSHGYKWNAYTKTLEKAIQPKFKVGDRIKKAKKDYISGIVTNISDDGFYKIEYQGGGVSFVSIAYQNEYELVPSKFDINTLKPFDKVLVRSHNSDVWECDFFSLYNPECSNRFHCVGAWYDICIPYIGNEHLRGTTNDCDEYYKTWE